MNPGFFSRVYQVVAQIPAGSVATYAQVAAMAGSPGAARTAGYAMAQAPEGLPCHRVIRSDGALASGDIFGGMATQRAMLEAEGVRFLGSGRVDLGASQWRPERKAR
jgi:methylated-DNA-protein-cysteine methyltransferase related protein